MRRSIHRCLSLLLVCTLVLFLFINIGSWTGSTALAMISMTQDEQGQMLYQSRQILPDQQGENWLVVVFKYVGLATPPRIDLMLAGCPGFVNIDHSQQLTLITSQGKTLKARRVPEESYTEILPGSNIAQYSLKRLVPELDHSIDLFIPTRGMKSTQLEIPSQVVQEWLTVATCADILCESLTAPALTH